MEIDGAAFVEAAAGRSETKSMPKADSVALASASAPSGPSPRNRYAHVRGLYQDNPLAALLGSATF